ncbi:MAG: hypothetical protein ACR2GZ_04675 [Solirubrobacteraceae bacterium]
MRRLTISLAAGLMAFTLATAVAPPAQAIDVTKPICSLAGLVSKLAGTVCTIARKPGNVLQAGKKLLGGHLGGAVETLAGAGTAVKAVTATAVLAAIVAWVTGGARAVLDATANVISVTTRPQLQSTWFSASYWRMAAIAALLTLPFLFAASIQALMRSDLTLLVRSAFGYLPLGLLAVSIAAPLTMLLLSASDELSGLISGATGNAPGPALTKFGLFTGVLGGVSRSTFIVFFIGLLTVAVTIILWIELLIRAAAVYVVVLMLPLFFAALVWPARRVWAVRAVELLVALILSKFTIVAVLSLGAAALGHGPLPGVTGRLAGATLVLLAACSPWALMRLLPMHELAGGLDGLRAQGRSLPLGGAESATDRTAEAGRAVSDQLSSGSISGGDADPSAARAAVQGLDRAAQVKAGPDDAAGADRGADGAPEGDPPPPAAGVSVGATNGGPPVSSAAGSAVSSTGATTGSLAPDPSADGRPPMEPFWSQRNWRPIEFGPNSLPAAPPTAGGSPADGSSPSAGGAEPPPANHDHRPPAQESEGGPL